MSSSGAEGAPSTSTELAHAVLQVLVDAGAREFVLAPGSRSAPLALALHSADLGEVHDDTGLRLHVRVDERTAGFLALGMSAATGLPVPVITTSGTAVGNLLPAVMEAHHSGRRLVVVSADRPARLRGTGANQTTTQPGIFGKFATCVDLAVGDEASVSEVAWQLAMTEGPVHVNVQLDTPLVDADGAAWRPRYDGEPPMTIGGPRGCVRQAPFPLPHGPRTVIVAGADARGARDLARRTGWPLLAEPSSGARLDGLAIRCHRLLLQTGLRDEIERVVVMGHPTLSRPVMSLISDPGLEVIAVEHDGGVTDPGRNAMHVEEVTATGEPDDTERAWCDHWRERDAIVSERVDGFMTTLPDAPPLVVAREVARRCGPHDLLVIGSSSAVRDLDVAADPWNWPGPRVLANRGLAGIDGTISTAIGAALAHQRTRALHDGRDPGDYVDDWEWDDEDEDGEYDDDDGDAESLSGSEAGLQTPRAFALLGDLTFLHDLGGLVIGPDEPVPDLTIVVVNDNGGAIFSTLEQGAPEFAAGFERVFATPHGADIASLCADMAVRHTVVRSLTGLGPALDEETRGIRVVEVVAGRNDRRVVDEALTTLARLEQLGL